MFRDDDYSIFSKKIIVIPFDPRDWSDTMFNEYLNYTRFGGTLIIINTDEDFKGRFSELFSIMSTGNDSKTFNTVKQNDDHVFLNISGKVKNSKVEQESNASVIASYRNNDNAVIAPFALEKSLSSGKIVLINGKAYFDAIYHNPKIYFPSLKTFSNLFQTSTDRYPVHNNSEPNNRFIGDVKMSGKITINSSSFSIARQFYKCN